MKQESSNNLVMVDFYMCSKKMDLEDVYNRMGITEAKLRSSDTFKHKEFAADSWEFKLDYECSNDIGIQLDKTMQIVKSKLDEIKSIRREYNAECGFCVVINYKDPADLPNIYCNLDLVALAADIDAQIAIEIYKNHDEEYFKNYIPPENDEVIDALVKARFYISAKEMNADQVSKRIGIPKDALDFEDGSVVEKTDLNSWSIETSYEESGATFFQVEKI
ncbi:MAG: DUF4279 domain-containing protein, partial [Oscillospiraceae bacterium]|nr:DUF4279 domain-containing protein [Oscillospiraceae bacterium]